MLSTSTENASDTVARGAAERLAGFSLPARSLHHHRYGEDTRSNNVYCANSGEKGPRFPCFSCPRHPLGNAGLTKRLL
jgi:hypothetical protein